MTLCLVQLKDQIFVKVYGCLSGYVSLRMVCMVRNIGKNISSNLCSKHSHKLLDHAKQSATDAFKNASKRSVQKTAEATDDLIWNKIADKITKASPKIDSETNEEEVLRGRYISPEQRQNLLMI